MQLRNLLFAMIIVVSCFVNCSFSLTADFNFNGKIRKVNNLSFNSYYFGTVQSAVPNRHKHSSNKSPNSLAVNASEQDDSDDASKDDGESEEVEAYGGENENSAESSAFTLSDDEEQSILYSGLPLDYSFNETLAEGDEPNIHISAPGCPTSGEKDDIDTYVFSNRSVWVHYGNPPRCYLVGSQGPCRAGMRLGLQSNSYVGKCKCKCFVEITKVENFRIAAKEDPSILDPFLDEKQSFCFDYDKGHFALYEDKCYMLLSQGPCQNNEAFVINIITNAPSCQVRECPEAETDNSESVKYGYATKHNGKCLKLSHECGNSLSAGGNKNNKFRSKYYMGTMIKNPMPRCISEEKGVEFLKESYDSGKTLQPTDCAKINQYYSKLLRRCVPYKSLVRSSAVG